MENGERLMALAAVRDFEHHLLGACASRSIIAALAALQAAISHAGRQCMPQVRVPPAIAPNSLFLCLLPPGAHVACAWTALQTHPVCGPGNPKQCIMLRS